MHSDELSTRSTYLRLCGCRRACVADAAVASRGFGIPGICRLPRDLRCRAVCTRRMFAPQERMVAAFSDPADVIGRLSRLQSRAVLQGVLDEVYGGGDAASASQTRASDVNEQFNAMRDRMKSLVDDTLSAATARQDNASSYWAAAHTSDANGIARAIQKARADWPGMMVRVDDTSRRLAQTGGAVATDALSAQALLLIADLFRGMLLVR